MGKKQPISHFSFAQLKIGNWNQTHFSFPISISANGKWEIDLFPISHFDFCKWEMRNRPISHFPFAKVEMGNGKWVNFPFPISRACNFTLLFRLTAIGKRILLPIVVVMPLRLYLPGYKTDPYPTRIYGCTFVVVILLLTCIYSYHNNNVIWSSMFV